jgi:hypothetical protein
MFARAQLRPYVLLVLIKPLDCARGDQVFIKRNFTTYIITKKINFPI